MKLSVAIVTYQHEEYISQALTSVLDQETDFEFDIVIGDDASTDRTTDVIRDIASKSRRPIQLIVADENPRDRGVTNFLTTVKAAQGEFVALLDGDDYWTHPRKLQKQVTFLEAHPECALCAHRTLHTWCSGKTLLSPRAAIRDAVLDCSTLLYSNFSDRVSTVVRRAAIEQGLPDWFAQIDVTSADWLFNLLVGRTGKLGYIDEVMATHRLNADGLTMQNGLEKMLGDKLRNFDILAPHLPRQRVAMLRAKTVIGAKLWLYRFNPAAYMAAKNLRYVFHRGLVKGGKE